MAKKLFVALIFFSPLAAPGAPKPGTSIVLEFPSTVTAGVAAPLKVSIRSEGSQAWSGTIHFSSNDPLTKMPPDYTFAAVDHGERTFPIVLKQAVTGAAVRVTLVAGGEQAERTPILVRHAAVTHLALGGSPREMIPGATSFTLAARDEFENIVTDYDGTAALTSNEPTAGLPEPHRFTAAERGVHIFHLCLFTPRKSVIITATAGSLSVKVPPVEVIAHAPLSPESTCHPH